MQTSLNAVKEHTYADAVVRYTDSMPRVKHTPIYSIPEMCCDE
jgi:hypothetical protein